MGPSALVCCRKLECLIIARIELDGQPYPPCSEARSRRDGCGVTELDAHRLRAVNARVERELRRAHRHNLGVRKRCGHVRRRLVILEEGGQHAVRIEALLLDGPFYK